MKSTRAILLASTALLAVTAFAPLAPAAQTAGELVVAQAAPPAAAPADEQRKRQPGAAKPDAGKPDAPKPGAAAPPQARPQPPAAQAQPPAARPNRPAAQAQPPAAPTQPPAAQRPQTAPGPQRAQQRDENRDRRPPAAAAQERPATPPAPTAQQPRPATPPAATAQQPRPATPPAATAQQPRPGTPPAPSAQQPTPATPPAPTAQQPRPATPPAPTAQQPRPGTPPAPTAQQPAPASPPAPTAQQPRPATPPAPTAQQPTPASPPAATAQQPAPAAPAAAAAPPPPTQPRNANEFIRRNGQPQQARGLDDIRRERRETRDGNRVVIHEGDRTIVRDGNRTIIRHSEADRFAVGARDVRVERRGNDTVSVIVRPNGVNIVSTTDADGHLIRRVSRDRNGREVVIIDNGFAGARRGDWFVALPPPVIRIPRDRYIVEAGRATPALIFGAFTAPPVEVVEQRYTVDQVRYSAPLRDRMPRVDLDINFDTGSWQLSPDQVDRLAAIAEGLNRAIQANPRELFLIEGYTDAVGTNEDNLSLSDRRAEAVAVALTEQFKVPPENLVTQGYGEEHLKVQTDAAEAANRYVAVRRITPLMAQAQTEGGGAPR